jgi:succinoglycan biosynthesis transport protein ExoP
MDDIERTGSVTEHLLEVWRRRKWLAIVVCAAVGAVVTGVVTQLPDIYRSTATVLVERRQVAETLVQSTVTGEVETRLQTISQEILSRTRLEKVIRRFGLYSERARRGPLADVADRMRKDIQLDFKGTDLILGARAATIAFTVTYRSRDPEIAAQVANALATSYIEENTKSREQQASAAAAFLKGELASVKERLDAQEQRVKAFRARYVGELPQQMPLNLATLERLNAQLHLTSANQLRAMDRRAQAVKDLADADPSGTAGTPEGTMARIARLRQELIGLRRFSDKYPDVIRAKEELASLERDLAESKAATQSAAATQPAAALPPSTNPAIVRLRAALATADAEIASLKSEEQKLRRDILSYQQRAENAPQRELELQELSRDSERTKDTYGSLLKRYEDAQLAENIEQRHQGEKFRLLDAALPATEPSAPNRPRLMLVGLVVSVGLAALSVVLAEHRDTSFHTLGSLRALV